MWQRVRTAQLGETGGSRAFPGRPVVKRSPSREGEVYGESKKETHITMCEIDSQWESAVWLRELRQPRGGDGEGDGREVQEGGTWVYQWLISGDVWQKLTKFCKAIILN